MRLDRFTLNRGVVWVRRICRASDVVNLTLLGPILLVVIWGAFRP